MIPYLQPNVPNKHKHIYFNALSRKFSITNARAVQAYLTMQVGRSDGDSSLVTQIRSSSPRKLRSDDIAESFKSQVNRPELCIRLQNLYYQY